MKTASQERPVAPDEPTGSEFAFELFRAPNGLEIFHHAAAETKYVYQEIFEDRVYFRHGISLASGESIFDIGANIGLFTMFVKRLSGSGIVNCYAWRCRREFKRRQRFCGTELGLNSLSGLRMDNPGRACWRGRGESVTRWRPAATRAGTREARCRRSPAFANGRRDYPYSRMKADVFWPCPHTQKVGGKPESPFELAPVSFCSCPDTAMRGEVSAPAGSMWRCPLGMTDYGCRGKKPNSYSYHL
jgi:hypothetical protein